jgi:magnesium-transporting ATPase (P-type)
MDVVPTRLYDSAKMYVDVIISDSIYYTAFLFCEVFFIIFCLSYVLSFIVDRNMRESAINRIFGSSLLLQVVRLVLFVSIITFVPLYLYAVYFNDIWRIIPNYYFAWVYLIITILISVLPITRLYRSGLTSFLRSDI